MSRTTSKAVLIDSNVLLDILTDDPVWGVWSTATAIEVAKNGAIAINALIYAEISVSFAATEDLERVLPSFVKRLDLPYEAAFLAGKAFARYKKAGGTRTAALPDFFIGAHASVHGMSLLTRDAARYKTYFPDVRLICPKVETT